MDEGEKKGSTKVLKKEGDCSMSKGVEESPFIFEESVPLR